MTNIKQSQKRIKQSKKKRLYNLSKKSILKTSIKKFLKILNLKNSQEILINFKKTFSIIDKTAKKKIIHKNKAARYKKKLSISYKKKIFNI
ncbi:30S ribosomal protein S20 [Candidatus Zinderia endosymbiont of Aphrophora alni]|uniref:30S ribosomal protein S20 n=1 Tax=Candidatus Zinderia endosymbiont of Aphrophora alni TaxID=3077951 RepID=UPI0030D4A30A